MFFGCTFFAARPRVAYVSCFCCALLANRARRPATQQQKTPERVVFFAARPPGTANPLTQAGPLQRRGHPAKKKGARLFCCTASRNRSITHSRRRGRWDAAATWQKKPTTGARLYFVLLNGLPEPLTHSRRRGRWEAAATQQKKNTGARCFFCCAASRNHSLTHAAGRWDAAATQ